MRRVAPMRRAYLAWLNHVAGGVSMNMIATKPARFVGRHEGVGTAQRLARLLAACLRLPLDRLRGKSPKRLPRTPEQAARAPRANVNARRFIGSPGGTQPAHESVPCRPLCLAQRPRSAAADQAPYEREDDRDRLN